MKFYSYPPLATETLIQSVSLAIASTMQYGKINILCKGGTFIQQSFRDRYAMRKFMGLHFLEEQAPDAINQLLEENGCLSRGGTIVDETVIAAPSSTKNQAGERDPEMHQTQCERSPCP